MIYILKKCAENFEKNVENFERILEVARNLYTIKISGKFAIFLMK